MGVGFKVINTIITNLLKTMLLYLKPTYTYLQGIMERVSALPPDVVNRVVELALQLLECQQDPARKNAAIFFGSAFVFRAILDSFDSKEGLQKFLNILQNAASVRSGGGNATPNPNPEVLTTSEKQIAYHTCVALRQYFRAHLLLLVDYLRPNKGTRGGARSGSGARAAYKPLDISSEAIDAVFVQIQRDRKLGTNLVRARWPVVDRFLALNGHITLLELCQVFLSAFITICLSFHATFCFYFLSLCY